MKHPLMSAMDLLEFMERLGVMTEFDRYQLIVSSYEFEPVYVLGKYEPHEVKEHRISSRIEEFAGKYQVKYE